MLIFFRKHYGHLSLLFSLPVQMAIYFRASLALLQMMLDRLHRFVNPNKFKRSKL
jgi:hypothetical protein